MSYADHSLGPTTEARFQEAFAQAAVVGKATAARLLGVDEKTVDALTEAKILPSVPKGTKHRGYTERGLRTFLLEGPELACATPEPKPKVNTPKVRYVNFSERRRGR